MSSPRQLEENSIPAEQQNQTGDVPESPIRDEKPVFMDLPEIPSTNLSFDFSTLIDPETAAKVEKVQKRQSNVLKLAEENEKLKAELKAMTDRLEAAERRKKELISLEERST
ncbi:hypothetical protein JR316_0003814 [Psilocybe cubensis]|uniref:Uncharacterized protein n=2 Tax=Psilocybe cubensis TaxID=181762 RepID=A0A8H7Y6A6_PSICU|nr:hypothetical protein JR316_0003814 [Psilocybe cubensis]KAH9484333.1 hypothetical protein JR316_0003814 [Psilocybe cubensis]